MIGFTAEVPTVARSLSLMSTDLHKKIMNESNDIIAVGNSGSDNAVGKIKGGRKAGARNWTEGETDLLLDIIQVVLPAGSKQWEKVALQLHQQGVPNRASLACVRRFNRLANVDKPTGSSEIPRLVLRAKEIKMQIDAAEVIGYVKFNDNEDSDDDEDDNELSTSSGTSLKGTNLADGNGNLRRPETKKRKVEHLNDTICGFLEQQTASANIVAKAVTDMADRLSESQGNELRAKVDNLESKLDILIDKISAIGSQK